MPHPGRRNSSIVRHFQSRRNQLSGEEDARGSSFGSVAKEDDDDELFGDHDDDDDGQGNRKGTPDAQFRQSQTKVNPTTEEVLGVSELQARKNALEAKFDEQFPHLKIEKERQRKAKEDQKKWNDKPLCR